MQLAGLVGVVAAGAVAAAALTWGTRAGLPVFFFAVLCGVRSMFHTAAGTSLVYADGERTRRDISRYLGIALAQSIVLLLFVDQQAAVDARGVLALGCALVVWPTVLAAAFARPRIAAMLERRLPTQSDFGFESMSALMVFFGACGAAIGVALLAELVTSPTELFVAPAGIALLFVACAIVVRSGVQLASGARGVGGAGYYTANENAQRYFRHGLVSTGCIAAGVFACAATYGSPLTALVIGLGAGALLWTWPSIVRRYYREQRFTVFLSGDDPILVRPPDGGAVTWGWLLVAAGTLGATVALAAAAANEAIAFGRSPWWLVAACIAQVWAGAEMVRMTGRIRVAGTLCGVITIFSALYVGWPVASQIAAVGGPDGTAVIARVARTAYVAFGLILGLASVIAPTRVPAPGATALTRGVYSNHAGRLIRR